jgi:uncharacterized membrane protein YoaK (UPF0700 family)
MTGTGTKEQGPLPPLLLTLTAVTGVVDAVSILKLGRVFVANMTGNVVFSAFAVVGAPGFSLSASLAALAGFLVGALLGGHLTSRLGQDRGLLLRAGAAAELVLVAAALALTAGLPAAAARDGIAALLALAMGVQNAVARRLAVPDLTTTVLTMTLTASRPTCGRPTTAGAGWPGGSSRWSRCSAAGPWARCSCCTPGPRPGWTWPRACWPW